MKRIIFAALSIILFGSNAYTQEARKQEALFNKAFLRIQRLCCSDYRLFVILTGIYDFRFYIFFGKNLLYYWMKMELLSRAQNGTL